MIPKPLARRLDRLSRRAHAFHRFAHHPLCGRYGAEVLRLGRCRLCRGCTFAALGGLAGLGAGLVLGLALPRPALPALLAALAGAALLALASLRGWRGGKLATRFLPAALLAWAGTAALRHPSAAGLTAVAGAALGLALGLRAYRRRGPDRHPCEGCPEGPPGSGCPGFAPIRRRERAFQRLAGRWLARLQP